MMRSSTLLAVAVAGAFALLADPAMAATLYSYTGNPFDTLHDSPVTPGAYQPTDRITMSFVLPVPVADNQGRNFTPNDFLQLNVSDGRNAFTESSAFTNFLFGARRDSRGDPFFLWQGEFSTDPSGASRIELTTADPLSPQLYSREAGIFSTVGELNSFDNDLALLLNAPGTWTVSTIEFAQDLAVAAGMDITLDAAGGSSNIGGLDVLFGDTTGGVLTVDSFFTETLAEAVGLVGSGTVDFSLPTDPVQFWDIDYDGTFTGAATLTFGYDDHRV